LLQTLEESKDSVTSINVSDHEILVGSADSKVRRYDLRNGQLFTGSCNIAADLLDAKLHHYNIPSLKNLTNITFPNIHYYPTSTLKNSK
jgi:WD40 repeat protein